MIPHFSGKSWKQDELLRSYCTMIVNPEMMVPWRRDSVWWVLMGSPGRWVQEEREYGWVGRNEVGGTEGVKDGLIHLLIKPQKLYQEDTCPAFQRIQSGPIPRDSIPPPPK